jgi:synaptojanin
MNQLGIDLLAVFGKDPLSLLDNDNIKQQHPFIVAYKNLWADNGDSMSMHYAGTGSTTSNITRHGKQNIFGIFESMTKSVGRFIQSNFEDGIRQECIEILTGTHSDSLACKQNQF